MTPQEEKSIIGQVISGNKDAFEALVLANQSHVYNLTLKMTKSRDDALDISQEAFIKAYRNLAEFKGNSSFSVWLYKITYNLCIDHLRKSSNTETLPLDGEDESGAVRPIEIPDVRSLPEDDVLRRELRRELADGINSLPSIHREIFIMREITGMSYEDIAGTLGISSGTVKSRLARSRLKLLEILNEKGTLSGSLRLKKQDSNRSCQAEGKGVSDEQLR